MRSEIKMMATTAMVISFCALSIADGQEEGADESAFQNEDRQATGEASKTTTEEKSSLEIEPRLEDQTGTASDESRNQADQEIDEEETKAQNIWETPTLAESYAAPKEENQDARNSESSNEQSSSEDKEVDGDKDWTSAIPWITLHGYLRVRAEFQRDFFLGRRPLPNQETDLPFSNFRPVSRDTTVRGGCGDSGSVDANDDDNCRSGDRDLGYANMRLRLQPVISLSDDVRVHMLVDIFDNMVLGSTPNNMMYDYSSGQGVRRVGRTPGASLDTFSFSQSPPVSGRNSFQDSIKVRRAWGEVVNRDIGELRFGRMGSHWGLGILQNDGMGIDDDFSSEVDRIMGAVDLFGLSWMVMWDFANEGYIAGDLNDPDAIAYDATQKDDTNQWTFVIARQLDKEIQEERLENGDWVLNGGVYFIYREQFLTSSGETEPYLNRDIFLTRRNAKLYIPDLWGQFLWRSLRLEIEAAFVAGSIENISDLAFINKKYDVLQFGFAFEGEYRLLDDKLGVHFSTGFATGDKDVDGLSDRTGLQNQNGDDTISTFGFHPNYRVDLILWRNIMGHVSGAYYFKPGVSYELIRSKYGKRLGGRFDMIYSGASEQVQTWGSDPRLGLELNISLYYQSEDGPSFLDGFYGLFQYGVLFPFEGLGYPSFNGISAFGDDSNPSLSNAHALRMVLGIKF